MQKLALSQKNTQRLTPQHVQLVKLLQIPTIEISSRIDQELADNPALEVESTAEAAITTPAEETPIISYLEDQPISYKEPSYRNPQAEERWNWRQATIPNKVSFQEQLLGQLAMLGLEERQLIIGQHLIGSIEVDGYIRRDTAALVSDILLTHYIQTSKEEAEALLKRIQNFDPPGIGARNLQECLLIQLRRQATNPARDLAIQVITQAFDAFTKKHYAAMMKKLAITDERLFKKSLACILKLNPRPGAALPAAVAEQSHVLYPDFIVSKQGTQLEVRLNNYNTPTLRVERSYKELLTTAAQASKTSAASSSLKAAAKFAKQKVEAAAWFIEALKQRQQTLLKTMQAIVALQHDFFMEGDDMQLKPMILKDVASTIGMDISTVSRIVSNKVVQTHFGIYPLKYFFTEAIQTTLGEEVSSQSVRQALGDLIEAEDKKSPHADEVLTALLQQQGFHIARRTVAKYREKMHLPVARLRKSL
jgi:RNA polymerase sigma-54 factor